MQTRPGITRGLDPNLGAYDIDIPFRYFTGSPQRIEEEENARRYVEQLDFSSERRRLTDAAGAGWSETKATFVEQQYKRWLYLRRKYEEEDLSPTRDVARFWEAHLLDTRKYWRETTVIFGYYLHYHPGDFLRKGGESESKRLKERLRRLYAEEFGDEIIGYSERQRSGVADW